MVLKNIGKGIGALILAGNLNASDVIYDDLAYTQGETGDKVIKIINKEEDFNGLKYLGIMFGAITLYLFLKEEDDGCC